MRNQACSAKIEVTSFSPCLYCRLTYINGIILCSSVYISYHILRIYSVAGVTACGWTPQPGYNSNKKPIHTVASSLLYPCPNVEGVKTTPQICRIIRIPLLLCLLVCCLTHCPLGHHHIRQVWCSRISTSPRAPCALNSCVSKIRIATYT